MSDGKAYSTSDPAAVADFLTATTGERAFARKVTAAAAAVGKNKGPLLNGAVFGTMEVIGLDPDDPNDPPQGWRYVDRRKRLEPCRGPAGAAATAWLQEHQPEPGTCARVVMTRLHGLPLNDLIGRTKHGGRKFTVPLIFHCAGTVWVHYSVKPGSWIDGPAIPYEPTWTARRLSEYHAAKEAAQAQEQDPAARLVVAL